ncbi:MAG: DUF2806 domain-containing protein [Bacteroidetes bacterium]|nr:DUF2806 domain-containing protein [Bacteroidota bacterium]
MIDPASLTTAIDNASKVANTPLFTTIIDKVTGFRISQWAAEGEVRKQIIHDEYEKAKMNGIIGIQYIENIRHTTNLIDAAVKSSKYIDPNKPNDIKIDNDFFWNTLEHAKTISNNEMQELIAKIIAGEYNQPGSYSMSTLQTIKMLGQSELELFENICSLCIDQHQIPQSVFSMPDSIKPIMISLGIDFSSLQTLQSLGLFLPNSMSINEENKEKQNIKIKYFDKQIELKPTHASNFSFNYPDFYELSNTGKQLIEHLNSKYCKDYYEWLVKNYTINNYKVIDN